MARTSVESAKLRKQVKKVQGRAKFVGVLYLLALFAFVGAVSVFPVMQGGETVLTLTRFYKPIVALFSNGTAGFKELSFADVNVALQALLYAFMLLGMFVNAIRGACKLGWLFKRRASRVNGVNRNMYAMDDLAKRFSGSLANLVIFNLLICIFAGADTYQITWYGYCFLGGALALHFMLGALGATVCVFTISETPELIKRDGGVGVFFLRNLFQLISVGLMICFLLPHSQLTDKLQTLYQTLVVEKAGFGSVVWKEFIWALVELVAWLCIIVLIKHGTGATEYNREGMLGSGMQNFRIFSFFVFLTVGALMAFSYLGFYTTKLFNVDLMLVAGIALIVFLIDCILHPREKETDFMQEYFQSDNQNWYNNTII